MDSGRAAKHLKDKGNRCYAEHKYKDAIRLYTQAIEHDPDCDILYSNRAISYFKIDEYKESENDSRRAIQIDSKSVKGHYYLAQSLEKQCKLDEADNSYYKALVLSKEKSVREDLFLSIQESLFGLRRKKSQRDVDLQLKVVKDVKKYTMKMMDRCEELDPTIEIEEHSLKRYQLNSFFEQKEQQHAQSEAPDYLCCKITFDIMRDPWITPSGVTYEKKAIKEHLEFHSFDPVTREPCKLADIRPNLLAKEMIEDYLKKNPNLF
ncbi:STIP1 homology and U-box containing protein [Acrasis kona]|uniref:E3 ubiquitin-protein ligase CHIP n=1 Tax=Acrasis kona TaxID=1008807 RepID=A0AAW2Z3K1_9EUKA